MVHSHGIWTQRPVIPTCVCYKTADKILRMWFCLTFQIFKFFKTHIIYRTSDIKSNKKSQTSHMKACKHSQSSQRKTMRCWVRLNLDKVCMSDPQREWTGCLISVNSVEDQCQKCQHASPTAPGISQCNPTSVADLQTAEKNLQC